LLATAGIEDARMRDCVLAPCWAVLLGFDQPLEVPFDGAFVGSGPLSWIARNNSKPGRPPAESWVLHAGPDWSTEYLEAERETVIADLLAAFESATGLANLNPPHRDAHRWRYALPPEPLTTGCLADPTAHWTDLRRLVPRRPHRRRPAQRTSRGGEDPQFFRVKSMSILGRAIARRRARR
jgi:renalase